MELEPRHIHAPELYGDFWFNGGPVALRAMRGRVVLLDFWDYACQRSLRALAYIKDWSRKYESFSLVTVGVHTPEFRFGRSPELVGRAVESLEITYPVVADNEMIIWTAYAVRNWPTRILVDADGFVRFVQHGEGGYHEFERALQQLLSEAGYRGELPELTNPVREEDAAGAVCFRPSAELSFGYLRGTIGNPEGQTPESTMAYDDPRLYVPERFYLSGKWFSGRESVRFEGATGETGTIVFLYEAKDINAVLASASGKSMEARLFQDDVPLPQSVAGKDLRRSTRGRLHLDSPRMYNLVRNPEFGAHQLRIEVTEPGLEVYSVSFTTSVIPETVSRN